MSVGPLQHGTSAESIARHYRAAIAGGEYTHGQQLPSTRTIAEAFGTSVATVTRAMQLLTAEGVVESRDRSSRVVKAPAAVATAGPLDDMTDAELAGLIARAGAILARRLGNA